MDDLNTLLREAIKTVFYLRSEGDVTFMDLFGGPPEDFSDEEVARMWLVADEWRLAAAQMADIAGRAWVERWRERGREAVEVDGFQVSTKKGSKYTQCNNVDGFWEEALKQPDQIAGWFNPNGVRIGSVPPAIRDTFFDEGYRVKPDAVRQPSAVDLETLRKHKRKKEET